MNVVPVIVGRRLSVDSVVGLWVLGEMSVDTYLQYVTPTCCSCHTGYAHRLRACQVQNVRAYVNRILQCRNETLLCQIADLDLHNQGEPHVKTVKEDIADRRKHFLVSESLFPPSSKPEKDKRV